MFICTLYAVIEPATELLNKLCDVNKVLGKDLFTCKKIIHLIPLLAFGQGRFGLFRLQPVSVK